MAGWVLGATLLELGGMGRAEAARHMETLNRGLIAVPASGGTYLSWRLWGTEPSDIGFNVYKGATKLNPAPLTGATLYTDNSGGSGAYTVKPVMNGVEGAASEAARVLAGNFLSIALEPPSGSHSANDASAGDLDGDGEYDIVLKWEPNNARDNAQDGVTGNVYIDGIKMNGTRLWRINLGPNIRAGAHYTQFMVADFDGNGKAEMIVKTADGTVDGAGTVIGDATALHRNGNGMILTGPEFLTVFDGLTGKALATTDYIPGRGNHSAWGDPNGNRVDRFLATTAYLDGELPSAVMCRGYYTRTTLTAWDWREGKLTMRWAFDTNNPGMPPGYTGQGNHGISTADVDADGKDEIIYGAMAVSHDGKPLWTTGLRHGDAMHVADFDPARPGIEIWGIHEGGQTAGSAFLNARTGAVYFKTPNADVGRGLAADVLASSPGAEMWGGGGPFDVNGNRVNVSGTGNNFAIWWDGDLLREMLNSNQISKPGGGNLLTAAGCVSNNGTKSTPALSADLFGDWREEVIFRTPNNQQLRIYTTTTPTTFRIYTLMHNPMYRNAISWQNVAYNQPPHTDFFLGAGMQFPVTKPDIKTGAYVAGIRLQSSRAALPLPGRLVRVDGTGRVALPLGYSGLNQFISLRDLFGRRVAAGTPREGSLEVSRELPAGLYYLQVEAGPR